MDVKKIKNLVLSGGSIRGYAFIGAIKALTEFNILNNITTFCGTSIGGVISLILNLKYTYNELYAILIKLHIQDLQHITTDNILNFFYEYGIDSGDNIIRVIDILIKAKVGNPSITFKELYNITKKKLIVTSVCVNTQSIIYYNYEDTPDEPVSLSIRKTISVPFLFKPVKDKGLLYVDGGLINNFPINLFENEKDKTLGILLYDEVLETDNSINSFDKYFTVLLDCIFKDTIRNNLKQYHIIVLKTNTNFLKFDISLEEKIQLMDLGYDLVINFLKDMYYKPIFVIDNYKELYINHFGKDTIDHLTKVVIPKLSIFTIDEDKYLVKTDNIDDTVLGELLYIDKDKFDDIYGKFEKIMDKFIIQEIDIECSELKKKINVSIFISKKSIDEFNLKSV